MKAICTAFISTLLTLLLVTTGHAQNENRTWHFGDHAVLHFPATGELPVALDTSAINFDGVQGGDTITPLLATAATSISDHRTGRVLFYSDGVTVWDSTHRIMQNGEQLLERPPTSSHGAKTNAGQGVTIVPAPCDTNLYYVFSIEWLISRYADQRNGLFYAVVDMRLNGGRGGVVEKQVSVLRPTTEGLTATMQANGRDYWVVTQEAKSLSIYAFPLTCVGLGEPTITPAPDYLQPPWPDDSPYIDSLYNHSLPTYLGTIHISPDGTKLAIPYAVDELFNPLSRPADSYVDIYAFDPATGELSNPISLRGLKANGGRLQDVAFSPDGTKLYWLQKQSYQLHQVDLTRGDAESVVTTSLPLGEPLHNADALQLGPDGRIYFGGYSDTMLSVVHQPNLAGAACQVEMRVVSLNGRRTFSSLPNTIESNLFGRDRTCSVEADFSAAAVVDTICTGEPLALVDRSTGATGGLIWLTPGGRTDRIESSGSSQMIYELPGEYALTQIAVASRCGAPAYDTAYGRVVVLPSPAVAAGRDLWICAATDTSVQLNAEATGNSLHYEWSPAGGLSRIDCPSPMASPQSTTSYVITVEQPNGCTASDTVTVWVGDYRAELGLAPAPAEPGDTLYVPLVIESAAPGGETDHLIVTITSDSTQFLLREELLASARILEGTVLEDWRVIRSSVTPGSLELELESVVGKTVKFLRGDTMLRIPGIVLLGSRSAAALSARLQVPDLQCIQFDSIATNLELVMCGEGYRSIRIGDVIFDAPRAVTPGSGKSAIEFSIPWESPVELVLYDLRGGREAVLIEGVRSAGRHLVSLPEVPAGAYFVCLVVGDQVFCSRVTVLH